VNRAEYISLLATAPITPAQRAAILAEFTRLGLTDRAERLGICAGLLGLSDLGSTNDLVMGQAGQLVGMLRNVRDRDALAALADDGQGAGNNSTPASPGWIVLLARCLYAAFGKTSGPPEGTDDAEPHP
jgi:hypothetical protein